MKKLLFAPMIPLFLGIQNMAYGQIPPTGFVYSTPAAVFKALQATPGVVFSIQNGWVIASDSAIATVWSFAPRTDPSYPTVVKRHAVEVSGKFYDEMSVMCGGTQAACDNVVAEFKALDKQMLRTLQSK